MNSTNIEHIRLGKLEVFYGPMYSGKTDALTYRLNPLEHIPGGDFLFFRPLSDNREERKSPFSTAFIPDNNPEAILDLLNRKSSKDIRVVAIDEVQFFSENIEKVIENLVRKNYNVIVAGLNLDFRGEPFGQMGRIITRADYPTLCRQAICKYNNCGQTATRTQRLINGKPASYFDIIKSTEGSRPEEKYEPRCVEHHFILDSPAIK